MLKTLDKALFKWYIMYAMRNKRDNKGANKMYAKIKARYEALPRWAQGTICFIGFVAIPNFLLTWFHCGIEF